MKYHVQPARAHLTAQRWSVNKAADEIGVPREHLRAVLRGLVHPSPQLRESLPALLGVKLTDLFTPEVLAYDYRARVGRPAKS